MALARSTAVLHSRVAVGVTAAASALLRDEAVPATPVPPPADQDAPDQGHRDQQPGDQQPGPGRPPAPLPPGDREGLLPGEAEPGRGLPAGVGMDHVLSQRLELAGPVVFLV
jgi:hypothetical protein